MDGNEDVNFLELSVKAIGDMSLEKTLILNERQCRNLLCHFQKCLKVLQEIGSLYIDGFGPIWKEFFFMASKAKMVIDSCTKDDWHQEALMQNANKETFRELLLELEDCVNTIFESFHNQHLITIQKMTELKCCTSFFPAEISEVEEDQISLCERLVSDVKTLPIDSNNFKLAKYLLEMMECSSRVEGGELDNIQFPLNLPCPTFGDPPESLGRTGLGGVNVYGTQWLGVRTATKTINLNMISTKDLLEKEASILAGLNHPNIIKFFYCGMKGITNYLLFGMEKGEKNLSKLLFDEGKNITYNAKFNIILQLASGMCYLHDMKVAHRDLKPENVIVSNVHVPRLDGDGYVIAKLVDFGISKIKSKSKSELPTLGATIGTQGYIAPEAINKKHDGDILVEVDAFKADVFSFGVVCYVILTQSISPFQELRKREELLKELNSRNLKHLMPNDIMPELCSLIEECWSSNPSKRPLFPSIQCRLRDIHKKSLKASIKCEVPNSFDIDSLKNARACMTNSSSIFMHLKEWLKNFFAIFIFFKFHIGWWQYVNTPRSKEPSILANAHVQENKLSKTNEDVIGVQDNLLIEVKNLLQRNAMLGICGMGGVGKTTLVKAFTTRVKKNLRDNASTHKLRGLKVDTSCHTYVSNNDLESTLFEDVIFISDMKDKVKHDVDYLEVMREILKSMKILYEVHHLEEGRSYLLKTLKEKRFLLIIDDVGGMNELDRLLTPEMFSVGGSKLIATSRDWSKLKCVMTKDSCKMVLETLDEPQAMKLFSKHAFKNAQGICPPQLKQISTKIVKSCDGLPLSLKVLGSHLSGQERIRVWERALQRLLKANALDVSDDDKLWSRLRLSFDDLNLEEEKIVMDICCFFCKDVSIQGTSKRNALKFWGDYEECNAILSSLESKSLVKIEDTEIINVHDQLRDIGRMISRKRFHDVRKWDMIEHSINDYTEKEFQNVEGLCFTNNHKNLKYVANVKTKLPHLRLLSNTSCQELDLMYALINETEQLRWLSLQFSKECEEKNGIQQNRILSKILEHNKLSQVVVLMIMDCAFLRSFPSPAFNLISLKALEIISCKGLEAISPNIGYMTTLESLILKECKNLRMIPLELCNLISLTTLNIEACELLENIPYALGDLVHLQELSLKNCKLLSKVPKTIIHLKYLTTLDLSHTEQLEELPQGLGNLCSLQEMCLSNCENLKKVPEDLGNLSSLEFLDLEGCKRLEELPESLCKLKLLQELHLNDCKVLKKLPEDFGNLSSLTMLLLDGCKLLDEIPDGICNLFSLQTLGLARCELLRKVPEDLGNLSSLEFLDLDGCKRLEELPKSLCKLKLLQELFLNKCKVLKALPQDLGNLSSLTILGLIKCKRLEEIPDAICKLISLQTLGIENCELLNKVPEDLGNLSSLENLNLEGCARLEELPESLCKLNLLRELYLNECKVLKALPQDLGSLSSLMILGLGDCEQLKEIPDGICKLVSLQTLRLANCGLLRKVPEDLGNLSSLEFLDLNGCKRLEELPESLCNLKLLRELFLNKCKVLKALPQDLGNLSSLTILVLNKCKRLGEIPDSICKLVSLQTLGLANCELLRKVPEDLGNLSSLELLDLDGCIGLEELPKSLCKLKLLQKLYLNDCKVLKTLPQDLGNLSSLTMLHLDGCELLEETLDGTCKLVSLQALGLRPCKRARFQ